MAVLDCRSLVLVIQPSAKKDKNVVRISSRMGIIMTKIYSENTYDENM